MYINGVVYSAPTKEGGEAETWGLSPILGGPSRESFDIAGKPCHGSERKSDVLITWEKDVHICTLKYSYIRIHIYINKTPSHYQTEISTQVSIAIRRRPERRSTVGNGISWNSYPFCSAYSDMPLVLVAIP